MIHWQGLKTYPATALIRSSAFQCSPLSTPGSKGRKEPAPGLYEALITEQERALRMVEPCVPPLKFRTQEEIPSCSFDSIQAAGEGPIPSHTRRPTSTRCPEHPLKPFCPPFLASLPPFPKAQGDLSQRTENSPENSPGRFFLLHPRG